MANKMKSIVLFALIFTLLANCTPKTEDTKEMVEVKDTACFQWRGADRSGKYAETNLQKEWASTGPQLIWETEEVGNGYGSPVVTEDALFIQGEIDSIGYLFSFDLKGKLLWKVAYGKEWAQNYPGSRSAPNVTGNFVYVCSGMGVVSCFDSKTGAQKWSVDMVQKYGGQIPRFGFSEPLLTDGDKVFCMPGGVEHNVVALNRFTGEQIWSCKGMGERSAYNPPNLIELSDKKILVTFSAYHLLGIDSQTGEMLWNHEQTNIPKEERQPGNGDTHSNTVYFENGFIYYVAGDGNCAVKLELAADGKSIKQVWQNKQFDNYMGGFIKLDNFIYASGIAKPNWLSLDATTGEIVDSLKLGKGVTIYADSMLYCYNFAGDMALVKPNNGKPQIVSQFKITKGSNEHFAHPVINKGHLYVRHGKALQVFAI